MSKLIDIQKGTKKINNINHQKLYTPIEVWFLPLNVDRVYRIKPKPGSKGKTIFIRPFCYRWKHNCLKEKKLMKPMKYIAHFGKINCYCLR